MNGPVVNHISVQAQFASLNNDREQLRNTTSSLNRERKQEEETIRSLRFTEQALADQVRIAHAKLGAENKKRQLLREETTRKQCLLEKDRKEITILANRLFQLEEEEKTRRMKSVKEIDMLNDELELIIRQYEERGLVKVITVDTAELFLKTSIQSRIGPQVAADVICNDSALLSDVEREEGEKKMNEEWQNVAIAMEKHIQLLKDATFKYRQELQTRMILEEQVQALRRKMLRQTEPLSEMELDELERLWDQKWENKFHEEHEKDDKDVTLIRGVGGSTMMGKDAFSVPLAGNSGGPSLFCHHQPPPPGQSTVDMDLFYGDLQPIQEGHDELGHNTTKEITMQENDGMNQM
uniref:Uncharacterized protein n=1 Tax=Ditylum brightwellii TaxID=49249 RepID=A0A6U3W7C5_9STRA|mmetsp:Transcript_33618/g.50135  ORF Transcript_33618/g.50135 Transcript_33618/m.50135 type:complete len:352 (+) Transcript_33618:113-1168(+)